MKNNKLNEAFEYVEDEYLDIMEEEKITKKPRKTLQKWSTLVAGIGLVIISAFAISKFPGSGVKVPIYTNIAEDKEEINQEEINQEEINQEEINQEEEAAAVQDIITKESYVDVSDLLISSSNIKESQLYITTINIENYQAFYTKENAVFSEGLEKSVGRNVEGLEDAFYLSGHNDLQYIIKRNDNNVYELWKFESFEEDEYLFSDVLEIVHGVTSEDDIVSIISKPANMDNSDEGKKAQEEIGTLKITNRDDISGLYKIISNMICYGNDNWDMIDYGANDTSMVESVIKGRYLTFELANGSTIDGLKYTGISGMFYEYSGIAYNELNDIDKENVELILEID